MHSESRNNKYTIYMNEPFIVVHIGAGFHSPQKTAQYKALLKQTCNETMAKLRKGVSAEDAVVHAISNLENSDLTNAGFGSNLNYCGQVECDAAIMSGRDCSFGSVGSVRARNAIVGAKAVMDLDRKGEIGSGRIAPMTLVGSGAESFLREIGIEVIENDDLISFDARNKWKKWRSVVDRKEEVKNGDNELPGKRVKFNDQTSDLVNDTVGAIAFDKDGFLCSGVSSGGIALKIPGRISEACIYGAGCWASKNVACSVSGTGEQIVKTAFARSIEMILDNDNEENSDGIDSLAFVKCLEDFVASPRLAKYADKSVGFISTRVSRTDKGNSYCECFVGHTTESMGVGYMGGKDKEPRAMISRKAPGKVHSVFMTNI